MPLSIAIRGQLYPEYDPSRPGRLQTFGLIIASALLTVGAATDYVTAQGLAINTANVIGAIPTYPQLATGMLQFLVSDIKDAGDTVARLFYSRFDAVNGKLRLYKISAGAFVEITSADLQDGDKIYGLAILIAQGPIPSP